MTTKTTMTRTIRLAIGTAAVLALMSQAAQARPLIQPGGSAPESGGTLVQKGTYMPVSPANNVAAAHAINTPRGAADTALNQLGQPTPPQTVTVQASADGFNWVAAAIGAGSVLIVVLIGAAALTVHGRRRVALSA
jgi:hypothetical protein